MKRAQKLFYKIGEASQICGLEPYVLRYWEEEFTLLSPHKSKSGQRLYRPKDLEIIQTIKRLLHDEGYTIAGARNKLGRINRATDASSSGEPLSRQKREILKEIREEAEEILRLVDRSPTGI